MDVALQVLVSGLAAGAVYGLVGVGHALVYRLTGVVHFAFAELIALAVFATLLVAAGTTPVTRSGVGGARFLLAVCAGVAVAAVGGAATYLLAIQPYQARGSTIGWVGASLAFAFGIRTLLVTVFDRPAYVLPDPLPFDRLGNEGFWRVGGATIQARAPFVALVALALAGAAAWTLARTRYGHALEAIAQDADGARITGLPVQRLVVSAFALAGAVAGLAAIVAAPSGAFDVDAAARLGLFGLAAAGAAWFRPWRAFAAGIGLGLLQAGVASARVAWRDIVPLAAALALLALHGRRRLTLETE